MQVFDDIIGKHVGRRQAIQIGKGLVLDPEDVQAGLVPRKNIGNVEFAPATIRVILAPCFVALVAILRMIASDEILEIGILHRVLLQCKVDIRTEIVDPHGLRLRIGAGRTLVEENDVCLYTRLVEDACGQAEDRVQITGGKQLLSDDFTRTALKEHVIRHDDSGLARGFQDRIDVLDEVELLVAAGRPEILTVIDEVCLLLLAFFVGEREGGFLAERRIGQHVIHAVARIGQQRIPAGDGHGAVNIADVVQIQIHQAELEGGGDKLISVERAVLQKLLLIAVERIISGIGKERLCGEKEPAAAAARIYKDAVFDTNENPGRRHQEAGNIKKSRAFTILPVHPAEL